MFPDPLQQARAIGLFGGCSAVASGEESTYLIIYDELHNSLIVSGILIGAVFVEWASYHWVFWFLAIVAALVALAGVFVLPLQLAEITDSTEPETAKWKSLDLVGAGTVTGMNVQYSPLCMSHES